LRTINEAGSCEIETTQVADDTKLAQIKRLILEAQAEKSPIQRVTDRFARYFIPAILLIAFVTFLVTGEIIRAITILIVACPCALVLGTPTAVVAAIGNAARQGILIKGGAYLEQMGKLSTLLFDKTGTLTRGKPQIIDIYPFDGLDARDVLTWAAIAEKRSEHPVGKAVIEKAEEKGLIIPHPDAFENFSGKGVKVQWNSRTIVVGGREMLKGEEVEIPESAQKLQVSQEAEGMTTLFVASDGHLSGLISISDTLRVGAREAINKIRREGIPEIWMVTGELRGWRTVPELGVHYQAKPTEG
jgi:P-type E1-E2 ATPase